MEKLKQLVQKLKQLQANPISLLIKPLVNRLKPIIIDKNTSRLYDKGLRTDGVSLGTYRPFTIAYKSAKGQKTAFVTLKDEGDFYASFEVVINETNFEIIATDYKTDEILSKYGEQVLGLSASDLQDLKIDFVENAILILRKILF